MRLMIEGDAAYLARVLAALDSAGLSSPNGAPITGTASSGPVSPPMPIASIPGAPSPMPTTGEPIDEDDDDDGSPIGVTPPAGSVDTKGMPWDERIHSKNKTVNKDGTWRYAKGLDDNVKASVEAQLRGGGAVPQPAPIAQPPMPVTTPPIPPMPPVVTPAPVPAPVAMPVPPVAAPMPVVDPSPPPAVAGPMDFPTFFQQLQPQMQRRDGTAIDAPYLADVTAKVSQAWQTPLNAITDLASHANAAAILEWAVQLMRSEGRWI